LYLPEAVFRKRLAAARFVLILGIAMSFRSSLTGLGGGDATLSVLPVPAVSR
jgi:hypothetical protein